MHSRALHARAAALDGGYAFDLTREASAYPNRRLPLDSGRLRALTESLRGLEPASQDRGLAELALGQLYVHLGLIDNARRLLDKQSGELANQGDLALGVANAMLAQRHPAGARPFLEKAKRFDKTRTSAVLLLGDLEMRRHNLGIALQYFEEAHQRAPAWSLPVERLHQCHAGLGHRAQADRFAALLAERRLILSALPSLT
jgi:lipopolysaccharide biosynthesis regulator YciM